MLLGYECYRAMSVIGLGGSCHWCTEGIFLSLKGVSKVNQGWIASTGNNSNYSEAIEVYYDPKIISLEVLIKIHLLTHASDKQHPMREKYRSAIYTYDQQSREQAINLLAQENLSKKRVTQVLSFDSFKPNIKKYRNYFYNKPNAPFCQSYIYPKLKLLTAEFNSYLSHEKLQQAGLSNLLSN